MGWWPGISGSCSKGRVGKTAEDGGQLYVLEFFIMPCGRISYKGREIYQGVAFSVGGGVGCGFAIDGISTFTGGIKRGTQ